MLGTSGGGKPEDADHSRPLRNGRLLQPTPLSLTRKPMAIPTVYSEYRLEVILAVAKDDQECSLRSAAPPFIWRTWPPPFRS